MSSRFITSRPGDLRRKTGVKIACGIYINATVVIIIFGNVVKCSTKIGRSMLLIRRNYER